MFYYFKLFFYLLICFIANIYCGNILYLLASILEIFIIFKISHFVYQKNRIIGYVFNVILSLVFFVQEFVFIFSGEYLTILMIDNIKSVSDLGDKLPIYVALFLTAFFIIFLPFKFFKLNKKYLILSISYPVMLTAVFFVTGKLVTPLSAFAGTLSDVVEQEIYAYESKFADKKEILRYFYRDSIKTGFNNYNFVDGGGIVISQI